ncbi:tRNA-binding protein [Mycobacterium kansasii]|nr:tRNA-binding protein [Mycobacterium kansasii]POY26909.1 tRNA-binding protein [Mycobacterium kansasii]POY30574.1 tRNA-binding protein [Mycobacterium kansasii]
MVKIRPSARVIAQRTRPAKVPHGAAPTPDANAGAHGTSDLGKLKENAVENLISWADFQRVDFRVGTIVALESHPRARQPAFILTIDLGPLGTKISSARITDYYSPATLLGRQVLCVCNFAPKNVAGIDSEVLVTGVYDASNKVVLAGFDRPLPNGTRLS